MANHFDGHVIIDGLDTGAITAGFGFGGTGATPTGPVIGTVTVDPSAGVGVAAALGSLALRRDIGQLWLKTGAGDTAWTQFTNIAGVITPIGIDTTGTADFDWDLADNSPTALSFDAAGAPGLLAIDTTNGAELVTIGATNGLRLADSSELRLGTGDDIVFTPDGTNVVVSNTGTAELRLHDDAVLFADPVDPTRRARLDVGAVTAGIVRTITVPDEDVNLGGLDGGNAAPQAANNRNAGLMVVHRFDIADAAGSTSIPINDQIRVFDVVVVKTDGAGGANDTVQVFNGANAITDAMSLNVADQTIIRPTTMDDLYMTVAAGGTLTVTIVDGNFGATDLSCEVFVIGLRV